MHGYNHEDFHSFVWAIFQASEFYVPTFRNISVPSSYVSWKRQCSETSAYKIHTPGKSPERKNMKFISF